jgi:hypothetical protein
LHTAAVNILGTNLSFVFFKKGVAQCKQKMDSPDGILKVGLDGSRVLDASTQREGGKVITWCSFGCVRFRRFDV